MDAAPTISTQGLTRRFGELVAVDDVNLRVAPGQFFGFLGPNGAGKSTTIKMLTGLLAPTSGSIEILGLDLEKDPVEVKRQIGVVPEGMALFGRLTGSEFLNFAGRMYGLDRETAAKRAAELLDFIDRKSTRLNSSHGYISYAVFCLTKQKHPAQARPRNRPLHPGALLHIPIRSLPGVPQHHLLLAHRPRYPSHSDQSQPPRMRSAQP